MAATEPGSLMTALLAVQAEAPTLPKNASNPHYKSKFTPLDTIVEIIGPILAKHGLVWTTLPGRDDDGTPALRYRLIHAATGETLNGSIPLLMTKTDPQGMGSAITYARRYAMTAVLNLVADDDDDGNQASRQRPQNGTVQTPQATAAPVQGTDRPATAKQRGLIFAKASEIGMPASFLANVVLIAMGAEAKEFADEAAAAAWLKRALDRLPAKDVDAILKAIESEQVPS